MKTLAFIPARGSSKRIPGKNRKLLAGQPLIAWTIETAKRSGLFADIVVSSDDQEILALAKTLGVSSDERAGSLAGDRVRFIEVLVEYLRRDSVAGKFAAAAVLLPTCPFRSVGDLAQAKSLFESDTARSIVSVTEYEFPPDFACDFDPASGSLELRHPEVYARSTQSQSVKKSFHPNGAIYWASVERILRTESFYDGPLTGLPIPPERAMDLDHPYQWPLAEVLAVQLLQS